MDTNTFFKKINLDNIQEEYYEYLAKRLTTIGKKVSIIIILVIIYYAFSDYYFRHLNFGPSIRLIPITFFGIYFLLNLILKENSKNIQILSLLFNLSLMSLLSMSFILDAFVISDPSLSRQYSLGTIVVCLAVYLLLRVKFKVALFLYLVPSLFFFLYIVFFSKYTERLIDFVNIYVVIIALLIMYYFQEVLRRKEFFSKKKFEFEKNKVDLLLKLTLPQKIIKEFQENGSVDTLEYQSVSVLFTDFVNFTDIAQKMSPDSLVKELDAYFTQFDEISERYNLEKLKTIGDSYMCAGGVPEIDYSHHLNVCLAALELKNFMKLNISNKKSLNLPYWELRIGIHIGPLIAGVIGKKKFAYDIWGDTVNIASRMESSGEKNKINISVQLYNSVKDYFVCTYRGKIFAKRKGDLDMYFLEAIKPEYSVNGEGIIPNKIFLEKIKQLNQKNNVKK